jgi:hypothetical protein
MAADHGLMGRFLNEMLDPKLVIRIPDAEITTDSIGLNLLLRGVENGSHAVEVEGLFLLALNRVTSWDGNHLLPKVCRIIIRPVPDEDAADSPPDAFNDGIGR